MHHGDDLVEHRTREASFEAQCTNHSAYSMCWSTHGATKELLHQVGGAVISGKVV